VSDCENTAWFFSTALCIFTVNLSGAIQMQWFEIFYERGIMQVLGAGISELYVW